MNGQSSARVACRIAQCAMKAARSAMKCTSTAAATLTCSARGPDPDPVPVSGFDPGSDPVSGFDSGAFASVGVGFAVGTSSTLMCQGPTPHHFAADHAAAWQAAVAAAAAASAAFDVAAHGPHVVHEVLWAFGAQRVSTTDLATNVPRNSRAL